MWIIGCDFHSGFQQLAIFDNLTGETEEKKLLHPGQAAEFYRGLQGEVRVGMESGCPSQWFRQLLEECRAPVVDRGCGAHSGGRDAAAEDGPAGCGADPEAAAGGARFPRLWVPTMEERDLRQLLRCKTGIIACGCGPR